MDTDVVARINRAVDECLERCTASTAPELEMQTYLASAQHAGLLFPDEISLVETTVRQILFERS